MEDRIANLRWIMETELMSCFVNYTNNTSKQVAVGEDTFSYFICYTYPNNSKIWIRLQLQSHIVHQRSC